MNPNWNDAENKYQILLDVQGRGNRHTRRANAAILRKEQTRIKHYVLKYIIRWVEAMRNV